MEELRLFGLGLFGIRGSPEMMLEVVKEAAQRSPALENVKVTVVIQSWGASDAFEVDGNYLKELTRVAEAVGAEFKISEVKDSGTGLERFNTAIFKLIDAHIAQQEDRLTKFEVRELNIPGGWVDIRTFFFNLQRASNQWSVQNLVIYKRRDFETLARFSPTGSINTLHFRAHLRLPARLQDDVKRVWRITDKFVFRLFDGYPDPFNGSPDIEIGGGKGDEGGEDNWQQMLQIVFDI